MQAEVIMTYYLFTIEQAMEDEPSIDRLIQCADAKQEAIEDALSLGYPSVCYSKRDGSFVYEFQCDENNHLYPESEAENGKV